MRERYEDALERIRLILRERTTAEPFCRFFRETAEFLLELDRWYRRFAEEDILTTKDTAGLREMNAALYGPLLPGGKLEKWLGNGLSTSLACGYPLANVIEALLRELTALIPAVYEKKEDRITAALELYIQIYCLFEDAGAGLPREKTVRDAFYSYFYDYAEEMQEEVLRDCFDPRGSYLQRFLLTMDTSSPEALYRSGEYVSPAQLKRFADTRQLSAAEAEAQIRQWREQLGFCSGTSHIQRGDAGDRKPYVQFAATPGREKLYQALVRQLRDEGIGFTLPRAARGILMAVPEKRIGYYESPNLQTDRMHDYDLALLMGDRITSRLLEALRHSLAALSREGNVCVAVLRDQAADMTTAGAEESTEHRLRFTEHQDTVYKEYCRRADTLIRAELMGNETAEEAEHETTLH